MTRDEFRELMDGWWGQREEAVTALYAPLEAAQAEIERLTIENGRIKQGRLGTTSSTVMTRAKFQSAADDRSADYAYDSYPGAREQKLEDHQIDFIEGALYGFDQGVTQSEAALRADGYVSHTAHTESCAGLERIIDSLRPQLKALRLKYAAVRGAIQPVLDDWEAFTAADMKHFSKEMESRDRIKKALDWREDEE